MKFTTKQKILIALWMFPSGATYSNLQNVTKYQRQTLAHHLRALIASGHVDRLQPANRRHRDKFKLTDMTFITPLT